MDEGPVSHLSTIDYDVLMLYDYRDFSQDFEFEGLIAGYQHIYLIGWSMGVWIGQHIFKANRRSFTKCIAINGTLCPIHDTFGIPLDVFFATLAEFNEKSRLKFYRRMCREKSNIHHFLSVQPKRSVAEQHQELQYLSENVSCCQADEAIYTDVIVSDSDWVIPSPHQEKFWQDYSLLHIPGFHYLFPLFQNWDHLITFTDAS